MKSNKEKFHKWVKEHNIKIYEKLSHVMPDCGFDLHVGQDCLFINDHFVDFDGLKILGFCKPDDKGACVFINGSSCFTPLHPKNILSEEEFGKMEITRDKDCCILTISRVRCVVQSYKEDDFVNLSPVQTGRETYEERLENIRIDFRKETISTEGKLTPKWKNFTSTLDLKAVNEILKEYIK